MHTKTWQGGGGGSKMPQDSVTSFIHDPKNVDTDGQVELVLEVDEQGGDGDRSGVETGGEGLLQAAEDGRL